MFRVLSNQHYPHRTNQKLHSWANTVFQNCGVCGQVFPSFPSPSRVILFFFLLLSQLCRRTRAETLAMQAIAAWIFESLNCWCIKELYCCTSMTRSKLSLLQDLSGDNILTWQYFFNFHQKTCDLFFLKITWLCVPWWFCYQVLIHHNAISSCVINMEILFHVWNLKLFKGQKYH